MRLKLFSYPLLLFDPCFLLLSLLLPHFYSDKYFSMSLQASAYSFGHGVRSEAAKSHQIPMPISYDKHILPMFLTGSLLIMCE